MSENLIRFTALVVIGGLWFGVHGLAIFSILTLPKRPAWSWLILLPPATPIIVALRRQWGLLSTWFALGFLYAFLRYLY